MKNIYLKEIREGNIVVEHNKLLGAECRGVALENPYISGSIELGEKIFVQWSCKILNLRTGEIINYLQTDGHEHYCDPIYLVEGSGLSERCINKMGKELENSKLYKIKKVSTIIDNSEISGINNNYWAIGPETERPVVGKRYELIRFFNSRESGRVGIFRTSKVKKIEKGNEKGEIILTTQNSKYSLSEIDKRGPNGVGCL